MRRRLHTLGAAAALGLICGALGACGLLPGETFEDRAELSDEVTSVRLEGGSGDVELRGGNGAGVSVHRSVEYRGERPEGATHRVADGVLVLGDCGGDCSVSYTVELPAGVPVSGSASTGTITLSDVGAVEVSTSSGRIELDGVAGAVDVRTSNGRITGRGLKGGGIRAQTSNGAISLSPSAAQDVRAKTSNGAIDLTVPEGSYRVSAHSGNGDRRIGVPDAPDGEHRLELNTSNGDITVESS
ncbi:DUF4097 domain-containing protein [Streptomyces chitinivorans]|uniref:DUF4097 domain-containing protein n=1 Tax=Streptomyces chitinivorans TaxID=1257027 RepID=A0ABW7HV92_9ACTN|nr:DUF4097 family beta strand repeat-containing protein [Streptomyces chitinivorans]MDH2407855.1 DUF4097 family beta strand repeat-containing protein [Streptomyces chitinivorans]